MADLPLGPGALILLACYVLSLLGVGVWGRFQRKDDSLEDHYLAGRQLGLGVLFLTLFATQYSGNTLFGFTGKAYRIGYAWLMSIHAMGAIVVGYLLFAPQLQRLAKKLNLITPGDYLYARYGSRPLRLVATLCMIFALANYTLAQLKVMGHAVAGLSGGRIDAFWGVLALAVVMVVYETLGGMRSVAWTDAVQGLILLFGFTALLWLAFTDLGGLSDAAPIIRQLAPEKIAVPSARRCVYWFSMVALVGVGGSIYPQAIQRVYAAKSGEALRRSLGLMALMPLVATGTALLLGLITIVRYPDLKGSNSDRVLALLLKDVMQTGPLGYWLTALLLAATLSALMSTADSALLSISSMTVRDLYAVYLRPDAEEQHLTRVGKWVSWVIVALLVWVATREHFTLVRLLEIKFEVLIQVAPAFYLGVRWKRVASRAILSGMASGLLVALFAYATKLDLGGLHAGVAGLLVNVSVVTVMTLVGPKPSETSPALPEPRPAA